MLFCFIVYHVPPFCVCSPPTPQKENLKAFKAILKNCIKRRVVWESDT